MGSHGDAAVVGRWNGGAPGGVGVKPIRDVNAVERPHPRDTSTLTEDRMSEPTATGWVVWVQPGRPIEGRRTGPADWMSPYRDNGLAEYHHAMALAGPVAVVLGGTVHVVRVYRFERPRSVVHVVGDVVDLGIDHWTTQLGPVEARGMLREDALARLDALAWRRTVAAARAENGRRPYHWRALNKRPGPWHGGGRRG